MLRPFTRHIQTPLLLSVRKGVWNQGETSTRDGIGTIGREDDGTMGRWDSGTVGRGDDGGTVGCVGASGAIQEAMLCCWIEKSTATEYAGLGPEILMYWVVFIRYGMVLRLIPQHVRYFLFSSRYLPSTYSPNNPEFVNPYGTTYITLTSALSGNLGNLEKDQPCVIVILHVWEWDGMLSQGLSR